MYPKSACVVLLACVVGTSFSACPYTDQWANCGTSYNGYAALFPNGCANPPSYLQPYVAQCPATCNCGVATTVAAATTTPVVTVPVTTKASSFGSQSPGATTVGVTTVAPTTTTVAPSSAGLDTSLAAVQQNIVNLHNTKRRLIPATGMLKISWDAETASIAQAWANNCQFTHPTSDADRAQYMKTSKFDRVGQNIAMASGTSLTWGGTVDLWYNEVQHFAFGVGSTNGDAVGHYTQVVWNGTYLIGCGYKLCNPGQSNAFSFFVCDYAPAGNKDPGQNSPYEPGTACSRCSGNCDNGLCTLPCPFTNVYGNCEVPSNGYPALYPSGCGGTNNTGCLATCNCKGTTKLYRL